MTAPSPDGASSATAVPRSARGAQSHATARRRLPSSWRRSGRALRPSADLERVTCAPGALVADPQSVRSPLQPSRDCIAVPSRPHDRAPRHPSSSATCSPMTSSLQCDLGTALRVVAHSEIGHSLVDANGVVAEVHEFLSALGVRGLSRRTVRAYAYDLLLLYRSMRARGARFGSSRHATCWGSSQRNARPAQSHAQSIAG